MSLEQQVIDLTGKVDLDTAETNATLNAQAADVQKSQT